MKEEPSFFFSAMNPEKFTHKTNEALASAHELALSVGHTQFTPHHFFSPLISDLHGIFRQVIYGAGGNNEAAKVTKRAIDKAIKKIPSKLPPPDKIHGALIKVICRAQSLQL